MQKFNVYAVSPDGTQRFLGTSPGVEFKPAPKPKMNLFDIINRGARHAPSDADRKAAKIKAAAEAARLQWLNALLVDQTRAWLNLGTAQREVLNGMATLLTIAGMVAVHDERSADTPALRVIRGAISAATQAAQAGDIIRTQDAQAFAAACQYAEIIIRTGSVPGIIHAAGAIRETVGLS